MNKQPLSIVKERFQDKAGLVKAVKDLATEDLWIDRLDDKGLDSVSNKKLLHLHSVLSTVKEKFGGRGKMVEAILKQQSRGKDEGYKSGLSRLSTPRLWDQFRAGEKRTKAAS